MPVSKLQTRSRTCPPPQNPPNADRHRRDDANSDRQPLPPKRRELLPTLPLADSDRVLGRPRDHDRPPRDVPCPVVDDHHIPPRPRPWKRPPPLRIRPPCEQHLPTCVLRMNLGARARRVVVVIRLDAHDLAIKLAFESKIMRPRGGDAKKRRGESDQFEVSNDPHEENSPWKKTKRHPHPTATATDRTTGREARSRRLIRNARTADTDPSRGYRRWDSTGCPAELERLSWHHVFIPRGHDAPPPPADSCRVRDVVARRFRSGGTAECSGVRHR